MKKMYLLLLVFALGFLFNACQDADINDGMNAKPTPSYDLIPVEPEAEAYDRSSVDAVISYMDQVFYDYMMTSCPDVPVAIQGSILHQIPRKDEGFKRAKCLESDKVCIITMDMGSKRPQATTLNTTYGYDQMAALEYLDFIIMCWSQQPEIAQGDFTSLIIDPQNQVQNFLLTAPDGSTVATWEDEELNVKDTE